MVDRPVAEAAPASAARTWRQASDTPRVAPSSWSTASTWVTTSSSRAPPGSVPRTARSRASTARVATSSSGRRYRTPSRSSAVKAVPEGPADDSAFRDRMRREARAAARLCHPQVNTVYDLTEDGNAAPYMVMELIDGPSLAERLRIGPLPWRQATAICAEVAAGLAAAHAAGLVHRDVKPGNVMLGSSGAKLVDFGISAEIGEPGDLGHDGLVLGTPAYVAPERLTGAPALPASDVYALGVLLYKSLTGRLPWDVDTKSEVLRAHLLTSPRPLPYVQGLPAEVADICRRALAKEPEARPSARELSRVCHHAVEGTEDLTMLLEPVPAARLRAFQRVRALVHGPRRVGLVAAGVLALGAIAVTTASAQSTPTGTTPARVPAAVADTAACQVTYRLWTDDGHAFTGDLTISNTGSDPLAGQNLTFTVPSNQQFTGDDGTQRGSAVQ